ncbi:putative bifunctional diguanylate cyclase/phosphodiesterase [Thioalkalivibrio sulfidiphilus]|uniref:cyclic-guanylate-specific phosphodiesterase n=1 Tax=Thioalkalivibrio sulfidiphilus (strain HL-EbGR7) TaxID=396588 RepID=B8GNC0_THISH|nr:EAL domain-containing protein [Thioalkalivibrio sulfidiphilus]ACL71981.1 signal transduction protein containing a membrane domain an EAL and a GGDEF domain [Thioalkalivibrio sulfidiphilus HL-EbGr7]
MPVRFPGTIRSLRSPLARAGLLSSLVPWGQALGADLSGQIQGTADVWLWPLILGGFLALLFASLGIYNRALRRQVAQQTRALREANTTLRSERDFSQSIIQASPAFFVAIDTRHRVRMMNPAMLRALDRSAREVRDRPFADLCVPADEQEALHAVFQHMLRTGHPIQHESHVVARDGERLLVEWHGNTVRNGQGQVEYFFALGLDITERRRTQAQLEHIAHYDLLTGLPNRTLLQNRISHALDVARRRDRQVAILFLDLDRFKVVNDSLGHAYGDELLRQVSDRLRRRLREEDTLARWGGDEFIVLVDEVDDPQGLSLLAEGILAELAEPYRLSNGQEVFVGGSIGISLYPQDGRSAEQLIMKADTAMYQAKDQGRSNYQFYTSALTLAANDRLALETSLRHALEREEFTLHYQPRVRTQDDVMIGMEALVRWHHPDKGLTAPDAFIPMAEETGLITPLGLWVLRTACRQAQTWMRLYGEPIHMAVNLSMRQLRQPDLVSQIDAILRDTGLPASSLELELTESVLMAGDGHTLTALAELKALGVRLAIDDFGTGYSSLAYLKRLPIDALKIDRSFVSDIPHDASDMAIASTIIAMARTLGLEVVAEGVETPEQLAFLKKEGCDSYQGFGFSPPVDAQAMTLWLDGLAREHRIARA